MDFHVLSGWGLRGPVTWHSRRVDRFAKYDHAAKDTINSNCGHDSSFISRDRKEQAGGFDDASKKKGALWAQTMRRPSSKLSSGCRKRCLSLPLCAVLNYGSGNSVRIECEKYAEICNLVKVESGVASLCHRCNLGFAGASASCRSVVSFEQHRKLIAFSTLLRIK